MMCNTWDFMRNHCYAYNTMTLKKVKCKGTYLTAQATEPMLYISTLAKLPKLFLSFSSSISFFSIPHPKRRILNATDAHFPPFQSISVFHRHTPLSCLGFYFFRKAGAISKRQCLERLSGPLSHSLTPFFHFSRTLFD